MASNGQAEDLIQVYRDAQRYDAVYAAARQTLAAGRERLPQGRALLLPNLNLSANAQVGRIDSESRNTALTPSFTRDPRTLGYTLTLAQPIYRPQNYLQYRQSELQVAQAEATFAQAGQDLIVRTAQAYFDVLAAFDTLEVVRAQKTATGEQLAAAKRNFEVGTATITDTHEAQSRFDLISAQEIAALNDLQTKYQALQLITGKAYNELKALRPEVKLAPPNPENMESWVEIAEKQGYPVQVADAAAEIAALEARRQRAGHLPTLDAVATYGQTGSSASSTSATSPAGADVTTSTIGLQFAMPLYQGGGIDSREREAAALSLKSKDDLENARRTAAVSTRQNYLLVINGISAIAALEQAMISSQSSLDSNKLGYEVGVRINIDVLNAQQQLYSTRRDLAVARYNTIVNQLKLKSLAASLREEDLEEVNRVLGPVISR
ncbi:MAG TPA: TolC family outer membrane protein [Burkholderiales bacterium]|jgi:outer membrane protein|nr:TolC family outer membrane protein [Burkholderiales bacterium]